METEELEQAVEDLKRELTGVTEMLAQVLYIIGEPVEVPFENLRQGLPGALGIDITENMAKEVFVFSLVEE